VARDRAAALGATVVDPPAGDVAAAIRDLTGAGAAVSVDAIGGPGTLVNSVRCLAPRGRHVQVGLLGAATSVPAQVIGLAIARELEIVGSHGMPGRDYPALLGRVTSGELDPGRLVRRHIGLDAAATELAALGSAQVDGITTIHPSIR
jgi:alcohol dehydrogenase